MNKSDLITGEVLAGAEELVSSESLRKALRKEFAKGKYEKLDGGEIYIPATKLRLGGYFVNEVWRNGRLLYAPQASSNIVVNQGLNSVLDVYLSAATQITAWYIGIFEGNYTPVAGDTAANIAANSTESTAYDESVRQTWVDGGVSSQSVSNTSSKATFTINATKTEYGAFMISNSTKSGTTGTLFCASAFSSPRSVESGDQLLIAYTVSAADA